MRVWLSSAILCIAACSSSKLPDAADASTGADADPAPDAAVIEDAEPAPDAEEPDTGSDPYTITALDNERINSHGDQPNFQNATAAVDFGPGPFESVMMTLSLDTTCFPFSKWATNPPPPGENWPADCDAFDRNFEVILDGDENPPGLELVRAITPFGGPLSIPTDITDIANGLPGMHRVKVVIPTYSDGAGQVSGSNGGWNVSLRFDVVPGPAPRRVLAVQSLENTSRGTDATTSTVTFTVPPDTTSARIEYRVTGHGGGAGGARCIGPAEEFCRRNHELAIDGQVEHTFEAWRTDCDQLCTIAHQGAPTAGFDYCRENPCGAIQSVRAPRANWCPGSLTPPVIIEPASLLVPGEHEFRSTIDTILPGGVWRVSATFIAFGD